MKNIFLLLFICLPVICLSQSINTVEAPIGFLRAEPKVTATILYRIQEKEKVKVIEKINQSWSKVEYVHHHKRMVGFLTNQTLGEAKPVAKADLVKLNIKHEIY